MIRISHSNPCTPTASGARAPSRRVALRDVAGDQLLLRAPDLAERVVEAGVVVGEAGAARLRALVVGVAPLLERDREFLAQLAQFSSVELANRTNDNTEALLDVSNLSQSIGLLGRTVNVQLETGSSSGEVVAMSLVQGQPRLSVKQADGTFISVSPTQISSVIQLSNAGN